MERQPFFVLVVDDEETTLTLISQVLEGLGFRDVDTALDGVEAFSMLDALQYHLVIADWHMKPINGLELLRRVRRNRRRRFEAVPFIMMSADTHPELERSALESGADAFLRKPFNVTALRQTLEGVIQRGPADVRAGLDGAGVVFDSFPDRRSKSC